MIEKRGLLELAKLNALRPWQQEKHYVQAVILEILADHAVVFKGGTYLWFFHGLPRFSEDLDFSAKEKLGEGIPEKVSKSLELFGIPNEVKALNDDETSLSFRVSAKGPLNTAQIDECRVYVEISRREGVSKNPLPLKLDFPAYNLPTKGIPCMDLNEVAAEKVRAIMARDKARDVFDLHYLVQKKGVVFDRPLAEKKLAFYKEKFSEKAFMGKVSAKRALFEKELKGLVFVELPRFNEAEKSIGKWVSK